MEAVGGKVTALSWGSTAGKLQTKERRSVQRTRKTFICHGSAIRECRHPSNRPELAAAARKIGEFELIICGEGSSDLYAQQVGAQLGEILNLPCINGISKITPEDKKIIAERTLENEVEVLEIPLPAVISVTTDINLPRIPSMKNILAAGKKPITQWDLSALGLQSAAKQTEVISTLAPEQVDRKKQIVEGESEEVIQKLFESIRKELL